MHAGARQILYGLLAITGLIATWYFNLQMFSQPGGAGVSAFIAGGFANPAASSLTSDLTVAALAFLVWLFAEARRLEMRHAWVYVVLTFGIAFAFSYPLFLLMRERRLATIDGAAA